MSEKVEEVRLVILAGLRAELPIAEIARNVVEAMREPTEKMLGAPEMRNWAWRTDEKVELDEIADAWRQMVDAELK